MTQSKSFTLAPCSLLLSILMKVDYSGIFLMERPVFVGIEGSPKPPTCERLRLSHNCYQELMPASHEENPEGASTPESIIWHHECSL